MSRQTVKCPICGYENEGVDLEETGGRAECYGCGADLVYTDGQSRAERDEKSAPKAVAIMKGLGSEMV